MKGLLICFLVFGISAHAQTLSLSGDNFITLDGERFKKQKIVFASADGDWFATAGDSHGTIFFAASFVQRKLQLYIEWDGREETHTITSEIRHQSRKGEFMVTMPDKDVYGDGLNAYPIDDDDIKIIIHSIDDTKVGAELTGTITQGNEKIKVHGFFNVKKMPTVALEKKIVTSSYKNYDNVVHDKLTGAENRSTSESEAQYDLDVRRALHDAFEPVLTSLQKEGW